MYMTATEHEIQTTKTIIALIIVAQMSESKQQLI
jgi:hypothetical protein